MNGTASRPVLVIGGGGLLGSHLRDAFRGPATTVTCHRAPVDGAVTLDLEDEQATRRLIAGVRPDAILVAAAEPHVERCEREPAATRRINVDACRAVADEARRIGAMLVVFSSEYVFDGSKGVYDEDDVVRPINEYGRQKVELERIARSVPRHLVCRTSGVFGVEAAGKNFVYQLVRRARAGRRFRVPSDQLITPTSAPALASAVARLVALGVTGTVNVAGPRILARADFAAAVCRAFDLDTTLVDAVPTAELGLSAARPPRAGLSDAKLRGLLGEPLADPEDALRALRDDPRSALARSA